MKYKIEHITNRRKIIRDMNPEFLTIHSTANLHSTAQNERDNLNRPSNTSATGFHVVIDDIQAIECIPFDKVAYHAGDGKWGVGNSKSIGVEMCESGNRTKTIENTIEVVAQILHEKKWGISKLKRHYDWSRKNCPRILNHNNWEGWTEFKLKVQAHLNCLNHNPKSHWGEKHFQSLKKKGIKINERRFNENMTRAEVFALIDRITNLKTLD